MAKNKQKRSGKPTLAEQADRHTLYELSVQNTESEFEFVDETFRKIRGRKAYTLREDFCGTANMSCEWVRRRNQNTAVGVDFDKEVLDWGKKNNLTRLSAKSKKNITLLNDNVLTVKTDPVDILLAMNFSYQTFEDRDTLRNYFSQARKALKDDGVFFLDAFGGYDAFREIKEKTKLDGFTYVWEQASYNPINGHMVCHINFNFPDGSKLKPAFTYEWRMWTLPELQELLTEAGFSKVTVYWEGTDEDSGEGNGIFEPTTVGDADPGWICYISAEK